MTEQRRRGRPSGRSTPETDAVHQVREKLGLTQQQMAAELRCAVSTIAKLEAKHALPAHGDLPERFRELAKRAGVSLETETVEMAGLN